MASIFEKREPGMKIPGVGRIPGKPGIVSRSKSLPPELGAMLLARKDSEQIIGTEDIRKAAEILKSYKEGKTNLEHRIVDDELWWELRHWESIRSGKSRAGTPHGTDGMLASGKNAAAQPEPSSAWLFNAITNKHADAMDNYPEPVVLPREKEDEQSARTLSSVLPVILEINDFEKTYSDNWWEKLKHGTAAYGVFWNNAKENGLGDIDIQQIDLLKLFWEPGITNIQDSRNLFIVDLVDEDLLEQEYPQHKGKLKGNVVDVKEYIYDDTVDTSKKVVVVDWYYKIKTLNGRTVLHYVKFVGDIVLYASQNAPEYRDRGFYDHGMYPVVLDVLFPEKGTPFGFGYVAICKDPQLYIDKLSANILENAMMTSKKRFFVSSNTNINVEEFKDWNNPIVHVEGELDDRRVKEIVCQPLDSINFNVMQMKIEEMKDTASNRDVNSGGTGSGVTAAAAIAALQEAGNKSSRDMISASYRANVEINKLCIELVRQFYDEARTFRITGPAGGGYQFVDMSNSTLREQVVGKDSNGDLLYRLPVFDLKIKAQKKNPFSRMEQNERAKEMFAMGFFNPQRAQEALGALEMMDFEGIDKVREYVQSGQTLLNICMQLKQENTMLRMITQGITGQDLGAGATGPTPTHGAGATKGAKTQGDVDARQNTLASGILQAQQPMTGYGEALAKRSSPDMSTK